MADRAFLTDKRRDVLNGEYEGADAALRNQKSRLRRTSSTALEELIEVAQSPEIDNGEVFDPDDIARLIDALMAPREATITPRWNYGGTPDEFRDEYDYQLALWGRLDHTLRGYGDILHSTDPIEDRFIRESESESETEADAE